MVDVHQRGKVETEDERLLGTTTDPVPSIHTTGAVQLTVLGTALQPGNHTAQKPLHMGTALLRDQRLPHMAKAIVGALRHRPTKATAAVQTTNGGATPRQGASGKTTAHTMLLLLARTSQLLHPQQ
jgi:hypothetical protein